MFVQFLWGDSLVNAVVERIDNSKPIEFVQLFNADRRNSHAYGSALLEPSATKMGWPIESVMLLVNHAS